MLKQVIWTSMIDYPGHICSVLFTGACNMCCKYCYNTPLKEMNDLPFDSAILTKLLERKELVDHVLLSGGECTIDKDFHYLVDSLFQNGFTIGIHTNGTNLLAIKENIDKISYFGIDYKSSKDKYEDMVGLKVQVDTVEETIAYLLEKGKQIEVRTTMYPDYVNKEDCIQIAKRLVALGVRNYVIQQFINTDDVEYRQPYTKEYLEEVQQACSKLLPTMLKIQDK